MPDFTFYHNGTPQLITDLCSTPAMRRLRNVGMHCGCEYTSFPVFRALAPYSRYTHSIGTGLITWHFTGDKAASAAALLHDIATPVFAHTVDFLNGDYIEQESTEERTAAIISSSPEIMAVLDLYGLTVEAVKDYHRYPIADNDSPKLSADRLEYTLGNIVNFCSGSPLEAEAIYTDIAVTENEFNEPELAFKSLSRALEFALYSLQCSRIYTAPEDRYAMQMLSELLASSISRGVITSEDLYGQEPDLIAALKRDSVSEEAWTAYTKLSTLVSPEAYPERSRIIPAKKRRIDPLVIGEGRLSTLSEEFRSQLSDFMLSDLTLPVAGI